MIKKVLIVDDNKMLCKLLAKKIESTLNYEVDLAFDYAEAKSILEALPAGTAKYFLAFADLHLPDAPNGELVDLIISHGVPTIVLTASGDRQTKDKFMHKDILDFISKEQDSCMDEILASIIRLDRYAKIKLILAMPKINERNELKKFLSLRLFTVLVAAHGEEALNYLNDHSDASLIICDAAMPVIDGAGLLGEVREKYSPSELGVLILGEKDNETECELLKNGANDYLTKPVNKELFNLKLDHCLKNMHDMKFFNDFQALDPISGVRKPSALLAELENYLASIRGKDENFALALLNIDRMRSINENYGYLTGDRVVRAALAEAKNEIKGKDLIGRYSGGDFLILLKNLDSERSIKIFSRIRVNIKNKGLALGADEVYFTASIGAVFGRSGDELGPLIVKAQNILALAKDKGRDRVEC